MLVTAPILHPIAAASGHYVAWYPGRSIAVLREVDGAWQTVRRLPFDNAGALAAHLIDGTLTPFSVEDFARVRHLLPPHVVLTPDDDASLPYQDSPQQSA